MTDLHIMRRGHMVGTLAITLVTVACSENRSTLIENPAPVVEAALVLSDSAPPVNGELLVSVQANSNQGTVGSYTARITYDPAALRYDGEAAIDDKGLRASNATAGLVRLAGAAATGFTNGRLASYRFTVLRANSAKSLALVVDEMHMISRVDAKSTLTVAPNRTTSR
jgi:hypothetical protein